MDSQNNTDLSEEIMASGKALAITVLNGFQLVDPFFIQCSTPFVETCEKSLIGVATRYVTQLGTHVHIADEEATSTAFELNSSSFAQSISKAEILTRIAACLYIEQTKNALCAGIEEPIIVKAEQSPENIDPLRSLEAALRAFKDFSIEATKYLIERLPSGAMYPVEGAICQANVKVMRLDS